MILTETAQLLASVVTALATIALVYVTWALTKATTRLSEATSQPFVVTTIEPSEWSTKYLKFTITNTGNAVAFDVRTRFVPPLHNSDSVFVVTKLSALRPGQSISSLAAEWSAFKRRSFDVEVFWKSKPEGNEESVRYAYDISHFEKGRYPYAPLVQIAQEVKALRKDLLDYTRRTKND